VAGEPIPESSIPGRTPERREFYDRIAPLHLAPLWEKLHHLVTTEPHSPCVPYLWQYDREMRPLLMQAGGLISAMDATRRVLILENPGYQRQAQITSSLFAGLQLILPGEIAPAHRHTQSALRFVIEGSGAYTAVDGERTVMHPGDFVITPSWTWHDHGNEGGEPVVWLDGLDIPIVRLLNASFAEPGAADVQPVSRPQGDSFARYGNNLLPVDWKPAVKTSPVFNYPYARTRETLDALARGGDPDPYHGHKLRYVNPATGEAAMPTIGTFIQLLPRGFAGLPYRSTDAAVHVCVEGKGETRVSLPTGGENASGEAMGGQIVLRWAPRDIFVVPGWMSHTHHAADDSVLFSFSDRPVQEKLGLWREMRGNAS
jgi:gentisate 1,2-dioxygenase